MFTAECSSLSSWPSFFSSSPGHYSNRKPTTIKLSIFLYWKTFRKKICQNCLQKNISCQKNLPIWNTENTHLPCVLSLIRYFYWNIKWNNELKMAYFDFQTLNCPFVCTVYVRMCMCVCVWCASNVIWIESDISGVFMYLYDLFCI